MPLSRDRIIFTENELDKLFPNLVFQRIDTSEMVASDEIPMVSPEGLEVDEIIKMDNGL